MAGTSRQSHRERSRVAGELAVAYLNESVELQRAIAEAGSSPASSGSVSESCLSMSVDISDFFGVGSFDAEPPTQREPNETTPFTARGHLKLKPFLNRTYPPACSFLYQSSTKRRDKFPKALPLAVRIKLANPMMPNYKCYQLLGDSQLLRFSEQLLGFKPFITCKAQSRTRQLGYCVSRQKINDLVYYLTREEYAVANKVIMLIGTIDLLYDTELSVMYEGYMFLINFLKNWTKRIVLLTVPPLPRLANESNVNYKLLAFNEFVKKFADDEKIFVLDAASLYMDSEYVIPLENYESEFVRTNKIDWVHLNRKGFGLLKNMLDEYLEHH